LSLPAPLGAAAGASRCMTLSYSSCILQDALSLCLHACTWKEACAWTPTLRGRAPGRCIPEAQCHTSALPCVAPSFCEFLRPLMQSSCMWPQTAASNCRPAQPQFHIRSPDCSPVFLQRGMLPKVCSKHIIRPLQVERRQGLDCLALDGHVKCTGLLLPSMLLPGLHLAPCCCLCGHH